MAVVLLVTRGRIHVMLLIPVGVVVYAGMLLTLRGVTISELRIAVDILLKRGRGVSDLVP